MDLPHTDRRRERIHVDVERATRIFGAPVVLHGYLTSALLPMVSQSMLETVGLKNGLNYGLNKLRFLNIVRAGQRVQLRQKMLTSSRNRVDCS
jgi:acyl dehydratase